MLAAILGASLALWLTSGDRDPPAQDAPPSAPEYLATLTVHREGSIDLGRDTSFYYLTVGSGTDAATRFTVAGDSDLRVMRWLEAHNGERISLRLGAYDPLRRDGEK